MLDSRLITSTEDFDDVRPHGGSRAGTSEGSISNVAVLAPKVERRTPCASGDRVGDRSAFTVHDDDLAGGAGFAEMRLPTSDGLWQTFHGKVLRIPDVGEGAPMPGVEESWLSEVGVSPWSKVGVHDRQPGRKRYNPRQYLLEDRHGRTVVDAEGPDAEWRAEDLEQAAESALTELGLNRGCARRFLICENGLWLMWADRGAIVDVDRAIDGGFWYLSQDRPQFTDLPLEFQDAVGGPLGKIAWALRAHRYLEVRQIEASAGVAERRVEEIVRLAAADPTRATRYLLSLTSSALDRGVLHGRFMGAVQAADVVNRDTRAAGVGANAERSKAKERRLEILSDFISQLGSEGAGLSDMAIAKLVHAAYDNDHPITHGLDLRKEEPSRPTETAKDIAIVRKRLRDARTT